jgi:hypothetical protein
MMRLRNLVPVVCDFCETPFYKRKEELKRTAHSFCSFECHGKWVTREAQKRTVGGFALGDDVIRRFNRRGETVLGIVNGFGRTPDLIRVIIGSAKYAQKQPLKWWMLLRDVDPVAAGELTR